MKSELSSRRPGRLGAVGRRAVGFFRRAARAGGSIVGGVLFASVYLIALAGLVGFAILAGGCALNQRSVDKKILESEIMVFDETDPNRDVAGGELDVGGGGSGGAGSC